LIMKTFVFGRQLSRKLRIKYDRIIEDLLDLN